MRERTLRAGSATPCENASDAKKRRPAVKHRSRKATLRDDLKLTEDGSIGCHYRTLLCGSLKKKLAARRGEPRHSRGWVVLFKKNRSSGQHHPGASHHPSSVEAAEEGSSLRSRITYQVACTTTTVQPLRVSERTCRIPNRS